MPTDTGEIEPRNCALLIMGYQGSALKSFEEADHLLGNVAEAIAAFRETGGTIAYVRMAFTGADYDNVPAHSPMQSRLPKYGRSLDVDSPSTAIHPVIAPHPGDVVVRKTRVGAFSTTQLDDELRARGITTLAMAGIATSGVVLTTLREAFDRDYQTFVLADATADGSPDIHRFLLEVLFPRVTSVVTVRELSEMLRGASNHSTGPSRN